MGPISMTHRDAITLDVLISYWCRHDTVKPVKYMLQKLWQHFTQRSPILAGKFLFI